MKTKSAKVERTETDQPKDGGSAFTPAHGSVLDLIAAERARQIAKGWTLEHDDTHQSHEIALVAAVYAMPASHRYPAFVKHLCPWTDLRLKDPHTEDERDRELVKAGALIVAELERRQRARNNRHEPTSTNGE